MDLPPVIPIFPLPNVVLFPDVPLPLHIFEERYRDMVRDAGAADPPIIGMVLLRGDWQSSYHDTPEVYPLGCAGQMIRSERLDDGRYNIVLQGIREFTIEEEVGDTAYRQARVRWRPPPADGISPDERAALVRRMEELLRPRESELADRLAGDQSMSDEVFVNFLSYALGFPPVEKMALLQAAAVGNRASRLRELLDLTIAESGSSSGEGWVH